jgi:uncharacterized protein YuzE
MHSYYDPSGDLVYVQVREPEPGERYTTRQIAPGVAMDLDPAGNPIGFEILDASKRYTPMAIAAFSTLDGPLLPLNEAAALAGLSPQTLKIQAGAGRLRAEKVGRDWMTTRAWLDAYLVSRKQAGPGSAIARETTPTAKVSAPRARKPKA